jgi:hypothetical protein
MRASIGWSPSLKLKYPNLQTLAEIERCQCISIATCKKTFYVQNCIKQNHRNCMITTTLESVMWVAIKEPAKDFDSILMDAIVFWKNATKFWYLFSNLEKYLTGQQRSHLKKVKILNFKLI